MSNYLQIPVIDSRYWDGSIDGTPSGISVNRHFKTGDIFFLSQPKDSGAYLAYQDDLTIINLIVDATMRSLSNLSFRSYGNYIFCVAIDEKKCTGSFLFTKWSH